MIESLKIEHRRSLLLLLALVMTFTRQKVNQLHLLIALLFIFLNGHCITYLILIVNINAHMTQLLIFFYLLFFFYGN